jgi:hypothetical protein
VVRLPVLADGVTIGDHVILQPVEVKGR